MKAFAVVTGNNTVTTLSATKSVAIFRDYDIAAWMVANNPGKNFRIKEVEIKEA